MSEALNGHPIGRLPGGGWLAASRSIVLAAGLMATVLHPAIAQETGTGGVTGEQIRGVLGLSDENLGGDLDFKLGVVLALTGPGSYYGRIQGNGAKLAAAQIKAAGGPDIELVFKDHRSADAQAGARAARELGIARVPAALTSYVGVIGSMFPGVEQYKILALDGGGGTSNFGQGKPYFWGMRAIEPDDAFVGALTYWKQANPDIERVSLVYIDQGPVNSVVENNFRAATATSGHEVASMEVTSIGATDYSATISRLKASDPDAVFLFLIGVDPGYFMKQYVAAGMDQPVMGAEYVSDAAEIAGPAFDNYMFSLDWFYAKQPTNPWSKLFVESYTKEFGISPEINAANYYEDTFAIWDLIRRVLARGGDVDSGEELQQALVEAPRFQSVYGGSETEVGTIALDTETHSVTERPLGVYRYNGGDPVPVATFELGGKNFKLVQ
jgi:branched-chain amino acid transport system substrate-binding protein